MTNPRDPHALGLTVRSTEAEVEATLREAGLRLQARVLTNAERARGDQPDYAVDRHFERYAYGEIQSVSDALALADTLDREDLTIYISSRGCHKARQIREWLAKDFWSESPERARATVGAARRVMCGAHETGSYAVRTR